MGSMTYLAIAEFARIVFPEYLDNTNVDILIGLEPMK